MFILENKRDDKLYFGLTKEEVEQLVIKLKLESNEWFAHLGM